MRALLPLAALIATAAAAVPPLPTGPDVNALRDAALKDELAWELTEALTTEVGPRAAGSAAEARARDWAVARLTALGFKNVRVEPFPINGWVRGEERAEVLAPFPQPLTITALGNSGATPAAGFTGEVIGFSSLEALEAAPASAVKGKIVFVTHRMAAMQDGSSYGPVGRIRRQGPTIASRKGAAAILIRSIGTDRHRNPHTGSQDWGEGAKPIPAAALSVPDAEQLERVLARAGAPVRLKLTVTPRFVGKRTSGNVIAEVPGYDPSAGIVLVGGHLDSWDLGTGAIDDAAGVAITAAAAKRIMDAGQPRRTIRVVWFGAEEIGLVGGRAYLAAHRGDKHAAIAESDFGADRVWRLDAKVSAAGVPVAARLAQALAPLGIVAGATDAASGSDIGPLSATGVPTFELQQDGTRYFDLHHTPDDTLDKIDPKQLQQNVAAWTTLLAIVANDATELGPVPPTAAH
ncbi:M20/M25/M40 family metallo-hydrolase [Sphingomonas jatrophae]|uniref:Carboxypeptidase Q n=1 Tax=Sphingomonas jatrophae TaxID=1166337 RepID=A0A1I6JMW1_9SPHN|nr:M20/M25/M40 family metallo-hydrolase [Sphingomonas jatrophae]SFR80306.1 Zn-dependent amino-or carboxypeptidase, M28 family [Sphingomonas jatrophae]